MPVQQCPGRSLAYASGVTTPSAARVAAPAVAGPSRLVWLDLARGLAVVSMVIAHASPVGGVFELTAYYTAPLFALLLGLSLQLKWDRRTLDVPRFVLTQVLRGVLLLGIGLAVAPIHWQVVVVLPWLGGLTVVLALLLPALGPRPKVSALLALAVFVAGPVLTSAGREWLVEAGAAGQSGAGRALLRWVVEVSVAGRYYQLLTFLCFALLGMALLGAIRRWGEDRWAGSSIAGWLAVLSAVVLAVGRLRPDGMPPDSGTHLELFFDAVLAVFVVWFLVALQARVGAVRLTRWLAPLVATGRMALSAYVLQLVLLRAGVALLAPANGRDDHWSIMVPTIGLMLVVCWVWQRLGWPRPIEWILRIPQRLVAGPTAPQRTSPQR